MCQFLIFSTQGGDSTPVYRKRFLDMLGRIHNGADCDSAFRAAFSDNIGRLPAGASASSRRRSPRPPRRA
jgi:hypothetical protein